MHLRKSHRILVSSVLIKTPYFKYICFCVPVTTIRPQIGIVKYEDLRQISVADLPGLIEGAHANIGMGHKFLKHIERTRLLLMVVDVNGFKLSAAHQQRSCLENVFALNKELEMYDESLFEKPCVLLVNKLDTVSSAHDINELLQKLRHLKGIFESSNMHFSDLKYKNQFRLRCRVPRRAAI